MVEIRFDAIMNESNIYFYNLFRLKNHNGMVLTIETKKKIFRDFITLDIFLDDIVVQIYININLIVFNEIF